MAALDNFRINDPNFQNTANELANRAYDEARNRGLSHLDALKAMQKGPMGLSRDLLSVTGTKGEMHGYISESIRDSILQYRPEHLLPPPAEAAPALTPSHLTGTKMGSAPQPALQTGAYAPEMPITDFAEPPLTEAQKHARENIPAEPMYYNENGDLVPAGTASINADQGDIVSNNTAALPTRGETLDNRRSGIMMNQDPARYLRDGSSLDGGMGNIYRLEGGDEDNVFQSLVKRYLDEGFGQKEAIAKAEAQMEKSRLQLLKENAAELGTFMMDKLGPDGERNYWPYIPFEDTELGRSLESEGTTEAREALPSMQDAQRMMDINNPLGSTGGALTDTNTGNSTGNTVVTRDNGALTSNTASNGNAARRMTGGYTGNARGSDLPDMQIGLNERLMRMGAAGLAAGGQGSLAQMGAMFGASANVNQANRQAEMEAFGIEEERRQAHAARVAALAASKNKGAGGGDLSFDTANQINNMQMALSALKSGSLTGIWDAGVKGWMDKYGMTDSFNELTGLGEAGVGARRAHIRNILQNIKVDGALAKAANTKGAISDTEMALFLSPFPTQFQDEGVWIEMLEEKLRILQKIQGSSGSSSQPVKVGTATVTLLP